MDNEIKKKCEDLKDFPSAEELDAEKVEKVFPKSYTYIEKIDDYRSHPIHKFSYKYGSRPYICVDTGSYKWTDWPEFDEKDLDAAYKWIDIYEDEGADAAFDYWNSLYNREDESLNEADKEIDTKENSMATDSNSERQVRHIPLSADTAEYCDDVIGQLSDGYWENSKMEKYWKFVNAVKDGIDISRDRFTDERINRWRNGRPAPDLRRHNNAFFYMDDAAIKDFFANKIKFLVKENLKDDGEDPVAGWKRDSDYQLKFLHGTVGDAYKAYDELRGRSAHTLASDKFKALDDMVDEAVELPETVYSVSYVRDGGPYQAIMVKADSSEEAERKVADRFKDAEIIGSSIEYDVDEMKRRGKPLLEEIEDDISVREWYVKTFPNDSIGQEIDPSVMFNDLQKALDEGADVYKLIGVGDSIVRERLFDKLADLTGVAYDDIYEKWVNSEVIEDQLAASIRDRLERDGE